jgi:hypothetical protein
MGGALVNAPPGCQRFDDHQAPAADVVRTSLTHRALEASALIDYVAAKDLSVEPKLYNDLAVPMNHRIGHELRDNEGQLSQPFAAQRIVKMPLGRSACHARRGRVRRQGKREFGTHRVPMREKGPTLLRLSLLEHGMDSSAMPAPNSTPPDTPEHVRECPFPDMPRSRSRLGSSPAPLVAAVSRTCSAPRARNERARPSGRRPPSVGHGRGRRSGDADAQQPDDPCIRAAPSARLGLPPRSPGTRNSSVDRTGLDYCSSMQCGSEFGEDVVFGDSGQRR